MSIDHPHEKALPGKDFPDASLFFLDEANSALKQRIRNAQQHPLETTFAATAIIGTAALLVLTRGKTVGNAGKSLSKEIAEEGLQSRGVGLVARTGDPVLDYQRNVALKAASEYIKDQSPIHASAHPLVERAWMARATSRLSPDVIKKVADSASAASKDHLGPEAVKTAVDFASELSSAAHYNKVPMRQALASLRLSQGATIGGGQPGLVPTYDFAVTDRLAKQLLRAELRGGLGQRGLTYHPLDESAVIGSGRNARAEAYLQEMTLKIYKAGRSRLIPDDVLKAVVKDLNARS